MQSAAPPSPLRVEFRNSLIDLLLFQAYVQLRSPVFLFILFGFALWITVQAWLESARGINAYAVAGLIATTLIVAGGLYLAQFAFILLWVLVHRDRNFYRPRTLELSEHSVVDQTSLTRFEMRWPAVHGVTRTPWCLYIRLTPGAAHCVPPRAFPSRDAYAYFAESAVAFHQRSRAEADAAREELGRVG